MPAAPTFDAIHAEAMRIWREREMRFPAFVRRMTPDDLDHQSGAWAHVFVAARESLITGRAPDGPIPPLKPPEHRHD